MSTPPSPRVTVVEGRTLRLALRNTSTGPHPNCASCRASADLSSLRIQFLSAGSFLSEVSLPVQAWCRNCRWINGTLSSAGWRSASNPWPYHGPDPCHCGSGKHFQCTTPSGKCNLWWSRTVKISWSRIDQWENTTRDCEVFIRNMLNLDTPGWRHRWQLPFFLGSSLGVLIIYLAMELEATAGISAPSSLLLAPCCAGTNLSFLTPMSAKGSDGDRLHFETLPWNQ